MSINVREFFLSSILSICHSLFFFVLTYYGMNNDFFHHCNTFRNKGRKLEYRTLRAGTKKFKAVECLCTYKIFLARDKR